MKTRIDVRIAQLALLFGLDPVVMLDMPAAAFIALSRLSARRRTS